jgi:hypothetical protein
MQALVNETSIDDEPAPYTEAQSNPFDAVEYLRKRGVAFSGPLSYGEHKKLVLERCVFNPDHVGSSAAVILRKDGSVGYKCFHNSCRGKAWRDVRVHLGTPTPSSAQSSSLQVGTEVLDTRAGWPEPTDLDERLVTVSPFSAEFLPEALRGFVTDLSERMQVPIDLPAAAAITVLSGAINRRATVQPQQHDTSWIVVPNLWGCLIAPAGFMKSPVLGEVTRPLSEK